MNVDLIISFICVIQLIEVADFESDLGLHGKALVFGDIAISSNKNFIHFFHLAIILHYYSKKFMF